MMSKVPDVEPLAWRRRKDARPQEILAAARQLIEEEGASATSMARIAKLAGVSEATVYKYYDSKQELVNQVLADWATPFVERLISELPHISGLRSQLSLIAVRFLRSMEETPKLHRVFYQELRWSDYRGSTLHRLNHVFAQTVVATVKRGIAEGEVHPDVDPQMIRDMLFGGLEHLAMRTSFIGRPIDINAEATRYVDIMLAGMVLPANAARPAENSGRPEAALGRLEMLVERMEAALGGAIGTSQRDGSTRQT